MLVRLVLFFLVATPGATLAQDLLSCVDPDVKQALIFQGFSGNTVISKAQPKAFADFRAPENLEYIGSSVSDSQVSVAYKSSSSDGSAFAAAVESLVNSGWQDFSNALQPRGGFRSRNQPSYSALCRDGHVVSVIARETDELTFINMSIAPNQGNFSCNAMMPPPLTMASGNFGLTQYIPVLSLPDGASNTQAALSPISMGSISSDGRSATTIIAISTQLSAVELADDFGQQLDKQKWRKDTQWSGRLSAGSIWSAQPSDTTSLAGTLDIVRISASTYQAYFRVTKID